MSRSEALKEAQRRYAQSDKGKAARKRARQKYVASGKAKPREQKNNGKRSLMIPVGLDGEGRGRDPHRYVMLCYASSDGKYQGTIQNEEGLRTVECLDFLLSIPPRCQPFGFALNYDWTKILADVDNQTLYLLSRPEVRSVVSARVEKYDAAPPPVSWGHYEFNWVSGKFSVRRKGKRPGTKKRYPWRVIWDVFKFFQTKFVSALEAWGVGSEEARSEMRAMKDQRARFAELPLEQIWTYCISECKDMAALVEKLIAAHERAGIELKTFYGAGSTSSAILKSLGIDKMKRSCPEEMRQAVAASFFGGRFEHSRIGPVTEPVWGYDISSAYPYAMTFLPCLEHAEWRHSKNASDINRASLSLIRYSWTKPLSKKEAWAPFPYRVRKGEKGAGSIVYPRYSGGGWVWSPEYFMGERLAQGRVQIEEAWIYERTCDCQPFRQIPTFYLERIKWGKEGPGKVLKLGINGGYGKTAQSIGHEPPFQSWPWASLITSTCRTQALELMLCHREAQSVCAIATDGEYGTERILDLPRPRDTGTFHVDKPLGGWEEKAYPSGMFFLRPGIYFPLSAEESFLIKEARGRGVGKAALRQSVMKILQAFEAGEKSVILGNVQRFHGMKSSISYSPKRGLFTRSPLYGEWSQKEVCLDFSPLPKREPDYKGSRLTLRNLGNSYESAPYGPATGEEELLSEEALRQRMEKLIIEEQPDGGDGFTQWGFQDTWSAADLMM